MRVNIDVDITSAARGLANYTSPQWRTTKLEPAIMKAGLYVQRWAQRLCPVDTGYLRNSAVTVMMNTTNLVRAEIRFANIWYAWTVHENLNGNVPRKGGPGGPYFLTLALKYTARDIQAMIAEGMRGR